MDYEQLLVYLEASWPKASLKRPVDGYPFDRLGRFLDAAGVPYSGLNAIGVTGSKGKGSIARLTAQLLTAHGLRSGLFTSPHLIDVEERALLDGRPLSRQDFARRFGELLALQRSLDLADLGVTPILLALALGWFREAAADVVVLEVRVGGRFDPTRIVPARYVCLGPIGLEHVPGLGYTLADIAWQKIGLARPGAVCLSAAQPAEADEVIARECEAGGVRLLRAGRELAARVVAVDEWGQRIDLSTGRTLLRDLPLGLLGRHQAENALLAVAAAELELGRRGRSLEGEPTAAALGAAHWPARLERLSSRPLVLYDGAHTVESAEALAAALRAHFPGRRWSFVLGALAAKNAGGLLERLAPLARRVLAVPVPGFDHRPAEELAALGRSLGLPAASRPCLAAALAELMAADEPCCVTGTLYLYGSTRAALGLPVVAS